MQNRSYCRLGKFADNISKIKIFIFLIFFYSIIYDFLNFYDIKNLII